MHTPPQGALTAITHTERLVDALVAEPAISNVYLGDHPTHWIEPGLPHDGYPGSTARSRAAVKSISINQRSSTRCRLIPPTS